MQLFCIVSKKQRRSNKKTVLNETLLTKKYYTFPAEWKKDFDTKGT